MNTIRLSDYSVIPLKHKEACEKLQEEIDNSPDSVILLNADRHSVEEDPRKPTLFKTYNGQYRTQEYVGVAVSSDGTTFVIGSRFDKDDKPYFLQYLFEKAYRMNRRIFRKMEPHASPSRMFELLLMLTFLVQFKRAARRGLFRQYRTFGRNDSKARGTVDFARHIRENTLSGLESNGRIACSVREFTVNNDVNVLCLQALERIKRSYPNVVKQYLDDREVRASLQRLTRSVPDWQAVRTRSLLQRTNRRIAHTVYREYETLRLTARLILRRMGVNVLDPSGHKTMGVVLNVSRLWEEYIEASILSNLPREIDVKAQAERKILEGNYTLKLDFLLEKAGRKVALDAKYVRAWADTYQGKWENCRDNLFQVMSYMYALNCHAGGVVFPLQEKRLPDSLPQERLPDSLPLFDGGTPVFLRIPVVIPPYEDTVTYEQFSQKMDAQNQKLAEVISSLWNSERGLVT